MRIFIFLFSLIISAGAIALAYFGFTKNLDFVYYMLGSMSLSVLLSLVMGHFMFRTWANRKRAREAEARVEALELEKRELAAARTNLETQLVENTTTIHPLPPPDLDPEVTQKIMMTPPDETIHP